MKKEAKGFIIGALCTSVILLGVPSFAEDIVKSIEVKLNTVKINVNGSEMASDNILYDGKTYVWIRDVCDMLGKDIGWDEASGTVSINDRETETTSDNSSDTPQPEAPAPSTDDVEKPTVLNVTALSGTSVEIEFSEKIDKITAEDTANYSAAERYGEHSALEISKAELDENMTKVVLTTSVQKAVTLYGIDISGIADISGNVIEKDYKTFVGMKTPEPVEPTPVHVEGAPYVEDIKALSPTTLEVVFNETVNREAAEVPSNYSIKLKYGTKEAVEVLSAALDESGTKVTITTSEMQAPMLYDFSSVNIADADGNVVDYSKSVTFVSVR